MYQQLNLSFVLVYGSFLCQYKISSEIMIMNAITMYLSKSNVNSNKRKKQSIVPYYNNKESFSFSVSHLGHNIILCVLIFFKGRQFKKKN